MLPMRARTGWERAVRETAGTSAVNSGTFFLPEALKSPINYAAPRILDVNDLGGSDKGDHSPLRLTWM